MRIIEYETQLNEGDKKLRHIEKVIEYKKKLLLEKQRQFKTISKSNKYLDDIKDDYNRYYNYILKQKHDQMQALSILNQYITDLEESGKLTKHNINDARFEKKRILNEIETIKHNLDKLIKDA
jgi:chromosome segregation ATPase